MEKFIVSARKYRPQNFNTVVGQSHITTTLKNAIRNHQLAHAFLFCGPRGVGKTTCARILAKTINCENISPDGEACNKCNSCISFNEGTSLNIHELDAASNNSVDDIRALVEQVRFAPQAGKYKVYIVDEVHMLSASAFNAFLKTLEEPPSYAIFILATTEKHKILPTILSRCQIFDFKRITNNDTVEHLQEIATKEDIHAEKAALQVIAQKSEGCMRDSLSILDKIVSFTNGEVSYQNTLEHLNILDHDYYFKLLDTQLNQDMAGSMLLYDEINRKGFEGDLVLNGYAEFIRNLLVCQNPKAASLLDVVEGLQSKYIETAKKVSPAYLVSALNILNEAEINYKMARNKRLHVEMTMIKLTFLQQAIELSFDNQSSTLVKKKRVNGPVAVKFDQLQSLQIKPSPATVPPPVSAAKLYIEPSLPKTAVAEPKLAEKREPMQPSQLTQEIETEPVLVDTATVPAKAKEPGTKKSLLDALRDKHIANRHNEKKKEAVPVTEENLGEHWKCFTEKLKQQLKHSVVTVFNNAQLEVVNDHHFKVTVSASLEQKFIEQEKMPLLEYLKECFHNRNIGFTIHINEQAKDIVVVDAPLSSREKYQKLIEQYPMIKELKDRLKLELDY
jgi:DNA polymerase-3 subunit gamma/tau